MNSNDIHPGVQLFKYMTGNWTRKPIYIAAELGIADILENGPKNIQELAALTLTHTPTLYRIMRALASLGIFAEKEDQVFELTPMAELLKTDALQSAAIMFNAEWSDKAWSFLLDSVCTGKTAFEEAHEMPLMDWLSQNPKAADVFNKANAVKAAQTHRAVLDVYDFSQIQTVTDIGGGTGALMMEILSKYTHLSGIIADVPHVIKKANEIINKHNLQNRCSTAECDFFNHVPSGSDVFILSHILHDWSDEQCQIILNNCKQAMKASSKLLIIEMIVPDGNQPSVAKLLDLEMLVITGGRERTEKEFLELLGSAGLRLERVIPTRENIFVLEAMLKV